MKAPRYSAHHQPTGVGLTNRADDLNKRPRLELPTSSWFRDSSRPPGRNG